MALAVENFDDVKELRYRVECVIDERGEDDGLKLIFEFCFEHDHWRRIRSEGNFCRFFYIKKRKEFERKIADYNGRIVSLYDLRFDHLDDIRGFVKDVMVPLSMMRRLTKTQGF